MNRLTCHLHTSLSSILWVALLLIITLPAFAIDTDNDGYDDSIDAFPNDACASVDTDGDGMPDNFICIPDGFRFEDFNSGGFNAYPWVFGSGDLNWYVLGGQATSEIHIGWHVIFYKLTPYADTGKILSITLNFAANTTVSFESSYAPNYGEGESAFTFSIDGTVATQHIGSSIDNPYYSIPAGTHTLSWEQFGPFYNYLDYESSGITFYLDNINLGSAIPFNTSLIEDSDDDNDGVLDINDLFPTLFLDNDLDGISDFMDWDDDNDGVPDVVDAEPLNNANATEIDLPLNGNYQGGRLKRGSAPSP